MATPLTLPEAKAPRAPSLQLAAHHVRLTGRLVWIWAGELWPIPTWLGLAGWQTGANGFGALGHWWLLVLLGVVPLLLLRSWVRGDFAKNVAQTYEAVVAWDWRVARLVKYTLPKLVSVKVHQPYTLRRAWKRRQEEGIWGLPAASATIEMRPHAADVPGESWAYQLEWWATNRYAFSAWEPIYPSKRSQHVLVLDMGTLVIPDAVTATDDWAD